MSATKAELATYAAKREADERVRRRVQAAQGIGRNLHFRCADCGWRLRRLGTDPLTPGRHYCERHPTAKQVKWKDALTYAMHMAAKADTVAALDMVGFTASDFAQARRLRQKWGKDMPGDTPEPAATGRGLYSG